MKCTKLNRALVAVVVLFVAACDKPDKSRAAAPKTMFDAASAATTTPDAMMPIELTESLPSTRRESVREINKLLAEHGRAGSGARWMRLEIRGPDTLCVYRRTLDSPPRRDVYTAPIALMEPLVGLLEMGPAGYSTVSVNCARDSGIASGSLNACLRGPRDAVVSWVGSVSFDVAGGRGVALRLRSLLIHAIFTLGGRPTTPIPTYGGALPDTRTNTLAAANTLLRKDVVQHGVTRGGNWYVAIDSSDRLVITMADIVAKHAPARVVTFRARIDSLSSSLAVTKTARGSRLLVSFLCKGQRPLDGFTRGCVHVEGPQPIPPLNAVSLKLGGKKTVANDIRALLYHALFTLKR